MTDTLTGKRREILDFIAAQVSERGYPPSVREIGFAVGLASTSTVQAHLNTLQRQGYLRRDPTKPRCSWKCVTTPRQALLSSGGTPATSPWLETLPLAPTSWPLKTWRNCSRFPRISPAAATSSCSGSVVSQ